MGRMTNTKKALIVVFGGLLLYLVGSGAISLGGSSAPAVPHHSAEDDSWQGPGSQSTPTPVPASADGAGADCDVSGVPDERAQEMARRLCAAAAKADAEAACLGDWQPPPVVNAREVCIEIQRRGCGGQSQDCNAIPAGQTYYTRH